MTKRPSARLYGERGVGARESAWEEFTPFLRFDTQIRRIVCTTNAIESVNARIRSSSASSSGPVPCR